MTRKVTIAMDNISRKSAVPRFSQCILIFPERKKTSWK